MLIGRAIGILQHETLLGRRAGTVLKRAGERVGPLAVVFVEAVMPAGGKCGERRTGAHRPVDDIVVVYPPVGRPRAAVVEEPVVVDIPVRVVGHLGRRAQPEVPVEFRRRVGVGRSADARVLVDVVPHLHLPDSPQSARLHDLGRFAVSLQAVLLGADLHDAVVLLGGPDHRAAFADGGGQRLFDVDVLAGLTGVDRGQGLPVAVGGHHYRVDILVIQQLAIVAVSGHLLATDPLAHTCHPLGVDVADRREASPGPRQKWVDQLRATHAAADQAEVHRLAGSGLRTCTVRQERRARPTAGCRGRGSAQESSSVCSLTHLNSSCVVALPTRIYHLSCVRTTSLRSVIAGGVDLDCTMLQLPKRLGFGPGRSFGT